MSKNGKHTDVALGGYRPPWFLFGGHLQTVYPALFRKFPIVANRRERIDTLDGDFLDIDWGIKGNSKLAIICHGLEGSSQEHYAQGMARAMMKNGWDALCWNYRGCSGETNRLLRSYHSGATDDLETVIDHAIGVGRYERIDLIGFSLGGNLILKYAGDLDTDTKVKSLCAFSVPCDLAASSAQLAKPSNAIYMTRFMKSLSRKVIEKDLLYPDRLEMGGLKEMRTFAEFDDQYTAPLNGFESAEDYWTKCSSLLVLEKIKVPTLVVNALNDPFLPKECYPYAAAKKNTFLKLETPQYGGHVGFVELAEDGFYWSERRAVAFLSDL